jgi:TonB family protein
VICFDFAYQSGNRPYRKYNNLPMWRKLIPYYLLLIVFAFCFSFLANRISFARDKIVSNDASGLLSALVGGAPGSVIGSYKDIPPAPPPQPKIPERETKECCDVIAEPQLIKKTDASYTDLLGRINVSGRVVSIVTVDEEGNVADIRIVCGHVMLTGAAIDALKQWKYAPTLLNGKPVPVITVITLEFNRANSSTSKLIQNRVDYAVAKVIVDLNAGKPADDLTFIHEGKAQVELSINSRSKNVMAKLQSLGFEVISLPKDSTPAIGKIEVEKLKLLPDIDAVLYLAPHRR